MSGSRLGGAWFGLVCLVIGAIIGELRFPLIVKISLLIAIEIIAIMFFYHFSPLWHPRYTYHERRLIEAITLPTMGLLLGFIGTNVRQRLN